MCFNNCKYQQIRTSKQLANENMYSTNIEQCVTTTKIMMNVSSYHKSQGLFTGNM